MTIQHPSRFSWGIFAFVTALIAAFVITQHATFLFGPPIMEVGDIGANALNIIDARSFSDLYGNYSRWGFNHPGPFFFYWYAGGQWLFHDVAHLVASAHQADILAGILLQSGLIAGAISLLATTTRRAVVLPLLIIVATIVLTYAGNAIASVWMPHVLLGPYILLLVACSFLACGRLNMLPLSVLMVCILCHGHVAQPLMSIPPLLVAVAFYAQACRREGSSPSAILRKAIKPLLVSLLIMAIFLLPIVIDLGRCPDCNAARILDYVKRGGGERPSWAQAINAIASLFIFDHHPEGISGLPHIGLLTRRVLAMVLACIGAFAITTIVARRHPGDRGAQALRMTVGFCLLAVALSCVWSSRITGQLFEFNSYFVYGIIFVMAATTVSALAMLTGPVLTGPLPPSLAWLMVIVVATLMPREPINSESNAFDQTPSTQLPYTGRMALINQSAVENWPATVALATWAYRSGSEFQVPSQWAYVFGYRHAFNEHAIRAAGDRVDVWEVGSAGNIMATRRFSSTMYCHITATTPIAELEGAIKSLAALRKDCTLAAFGLPDPVSSPQPAYVDGTVYLQFRSRSAQNAVVLQVEVASTPHAKDVPVTVKVNGQDVGIQAVEQHGPVSVRIPATLWNRSQITTVELSPTDDASRPERDATGSTSHPPLDIRGIGLTYE
ncbi:hypothetical protein [Luteibacter sp.]|uniref:hypothetical protein n=1 Tax=Luteibacter sp. TaxID=1886636 RepID=UPI0025C6223D|nr:hypothetical protein [Luteibacter sp.]